MNRNVPSSPQQNNAMQQMMNGVPVPTAASRSGMVAGAGGVIPPALLDESRLPPFYHEAIVRCGAAAPHYLPNTALVYNLMVQSNLPRPTLSYIWSAVNRTLPGQLTRPEFFSCLALIALAQKGESLVALSSVRALPVPVFQSMPSAPSASLPSVSFSQRQSRPPQPTPLEKPIQTSPSSQHPLFVPSSLLSQPSKRSQVDLLGDVVTPSQSSPVQSSPSSSSAFVTESRSTLDRPSVESFPETTISFITPSVPQREREEHIAEKCVTAALELFSEARNFVQGDPELFKEVSLTEKGARYVDALASIHRVLTRLAARPPLSTQLEQKIRLAEELWAGVAPYRNELSSDENVDSEGKNVTLSCHICMQPVTEAVDYAGKHFHAECANLWINFVDTRLP